MTLYDDADIAAIHDDSLAKAKDALGNLPVAGTEEPQFGGLNGWVLEQTVRHCLLAELEAAGIKATVLHQQPLRRRVKVDLFVHDVAYVEVKAAGLFGLKDAAKYGGYRSEAERSGKAFLYVCRSETSTAFRDATVQALGEENVFILDGKSAAWDRFVHRVRNLLGG